MSDESTKLREPTQTERRLLQALVQRVPHLSRSDELFDGILVEPLDDGGMGSFRIASKNPHREHRHFGEVVATLQFIDSDGILVQVSLNTDARGDVFEVDVWKTDFSPVIHVPDDLRR